MNYLKFAFFLNLLFIFNLNAQNKDVSLEEIWNGAFRTEGIDVLHAMKNGQHYSVLNFDRT